jgi:hypothetical protein
MSAGCWRVKPSEVERTLKSIQKVGLHVRSIEVLTDGGLKINVVEAGEPDVAAETPESLRRLL